MGGPSKTACCTLQSSLQAPHRPPAFCSLVWADDSPPDILFLRQEPSLLTHSPHGVPIDGCSHSFVHQASYLAVNFWGGRAGHEGIQRGPADSLCPQAQKDPGWAEVDFPNPKASLHWPIPNYGVVTVMASQGWGPPPPTGLGKSTSGINPT